MDFNKMITIVEDASIEKAQEKIFFFLLRKSIFI